MEEKKVVIMKLKVDLHCRKCFKKLKKILCKYSQIRDQLYDEKNGVVTIRVVCCSPERIRDNICCQGGGSIKSIEIVEPPKPKPAPEKPKEQEKMLEAEQKPKSHPSPNPAPTPAPPASAAAPAIMFHEGTPMSILAYPSPAVPVGLVYGAGPGGPSQVYGRPIYDSYGWSGPSYLGPHHEYLHEEEASTCTIS